MPLARLFLHLLKFPALAGGWLCRRRLNLLTERPRISAQQGLLSMNQEGRSSNEILKKQGVRHALTLMQGLEAKEEEQCAGSQCHLLINRRPSNETRS